VSTADRDVDDRYPALRDRYAANNAKANGYRFQLYFKREQAMVLSLLDTQASDIVDIGCGSGLMLLPLVEQGKRVIGVDFNDAACRAAYGQGLVAVRADAYHLPFSDGFADVAVNCQFLNQQSPQAAIDLVAEVQRVLRPGGMAVLVWRNGSALIHRVAHRFYRWLDKLTSRPEFPLVLHSLDQVCRAVLAADLTIERRALVFPLLGWASTKSDDGLARIIGASCLLVVRKPLET
jgi:ubiquinone/menaquinone biosynthesis C-methylase UbiE